jgi:hypothetical protein
MTLADLERHASPEAVRLAVQVLETDIATQAWVAQVGYSLTQSATAELLGRSEQAVSKDPRLVRLERSDGRPAYPMFQFDGRKQVAGIHDVVRTLQGALTPAGIAAWLTGTVPQLGNRRPIDCLRAGEIQEVVSLAQRLGDRLSH